MKVCMFDFFFIYLSGEGGGSLVLVGIFFFLLLFVLFCYVLYLVILFVHTIKNFLCNVILCF